MGEGRPEIDIVFNRVRAGLYNIGIDQVGSQLMMQLMGTDSGQWESEGEMRDIRIELPHIGINQLEDIIIKNGDENIFLYEIANINTSQAPEEI